MKKKFGIAFIMALALILMIAPVALAGPTDIVVTWDGAGTVTGDVDANDDAHSSFIASGAATDGTFRVYDSNTNWYGYGVDDVLTEFVGNVSNGSLDVQHDRNDSGPYGAAGQSSWSYVGTDGTAAMAFRTESNYASMVDASYNHQLIGGHNIVVSGAQGYLIDRGILDGRGNRAQILATGDGSATLDCMTSGASGVWDLQFGRGGGCYTDASFAALGGSGIFSVSGTGNNDVTYHGMGMTSGGGTLSIVANWVNNFSIADYSLSAN